MKVQRALDVLPPCNAIGPLHLVIHVVQNRHTEEPETHRERTNKGLTTLIAFSVPVRLLFSSMAVLYPVNDKLQRACCHTIESTLANIFRSGQRVSFSKCKFKTGLCRVLPQSNAVSSVIKYGGTAEANTSLVP